MNIKKQRVALYLRKSREDLLNETDEETLARHERVLLDFCRKNNLKVVEIYKELKSAVQIANRPVMRQMMNDIEDGLYDGVVVIELERLCRGNLIDIQMVEDCFSKSNTIIYTPSKKYILSSQKEKNDFVRDLDKHSYILKMILSNFEYESIQIRLSRGRLLALQEGYFVNNRPIFGYKKEKIGRGYVLVPDDNSHYVKEIFNRYLYHEPSTIIEWLNTLSLSDYKGKKIIWDNTKLSRLIKNKTYIGYNKGKNERGERTYFKGKQEPIIDDEIFNQANLILDSHHHPIKTSDLINNSFVGILKCGVCGKAMYIKGPNSSLKQCFCDCLTPNCNCVGAYYDDLEDKFIIEINRLLQEKINYIKDFKDYMEIRKEEIKNNLEFRRHDLEVNQRRLNNCYLLLEDGTYNKETFYERKDIIEERINNDIERIEMLEKEDVVEEYNNNLKELEYIRTIIYKYRKLKTPKFKNMMLKKYIERIEYNKVTRGGLDKQNRVNMINLNIQFM